VLQQGNERAAPPAGGLALLLGDVRHREEQSSDAWGAWGVEPESGATGVGLTSLGCTGNEDHVPCQSPSGQGHNLSWKHWPRGGMRRRLSLGHVGPLVAFVGEEGPWTEARNEETTAWELGMCHPWAPCDIDNQSRPGDESSRSLLSQRAGQLRAGPGAAESLQIGKLHRGAACDGRERRVERTVVPFPRTDTCPPPSAAASICRSRESSDYCPLPGTGGPTAAVRICQF
jgi:hypothetical protein